MKSKEEKYKGHTITVEKITGYAWTIETPDGEIPFDSSATLHDKPSDAMDEAMELIDILITVPVGENVNAKSSGTAIGDLQRKAKILEDIGISLHTEWEDKETNYSAVINAMELYASSVSAEDKKRIEELTKEVEDLESKNDAIDAANEVLESAIEELLAELKKCAEEENYFTRTAIICKGMQDKYLKK